MGYKITMLLLFNGRVYFKLVFCNFPKGLGLIPRIFQEDVCRQLAYSWTEGYVIGLNDPTVTFDSFNPDNPEHRSLECLEIYPWGEQH